MEVLALLALVGVGFLVAGVGFAILALLKLVFWIVFLPIRLAFRLLTLPFLLIKWTIGGLFGLLLIPLALLAGLALVVALISALVVPLLPFLFVAFAIWAVAKLVMRPAVA